MSETMAKRRSSTWTGWALFVAFVGSVVLANVVTSNWGLVPAGFGLLVPAGTYCAGLALSLRDALHDASDSRVVLVAIGTGAALSYPLADPLIAVASGVAFALSETADLLVYLPIRRRRPRLAVAMSNTVGSAVDTWLFLWIAPFAITAEAFGGQIMVKALWVTGLYLATREVVHRVTGKGRRDLSGECLHSKGA